MRSIYEGNVIVRVALVLVFGGILWSLPYVSLAETFRDDLGREVSIPRIPQRIIALSPSVTELLFFLGLGERVAGVTEFSDHLSEAAKKPKVGSFVHINVEKIVDLNPDLVIAGADRNHPAIVGLLERAGIKAYVINPRNVQQVIESVKGVGRLCGIPERADALAADLNARLDRVLGKTRSGKKPLVLFQINIRPIMTVNRDTLHHDLIHLAGGVNMSADEPIPYPRISMEEVIRKGPEVIIISSMERGGHFEEARSEWMRWKGVPAVRDGRVHLINADITDRPSPRVLEGLERMARIIHPEAGWQ